MSLADWNKDNILKFSIDYENVDKPLIDFPVLLNLSSGSGKNNYDCSAIFEELNFDMTGDNFTGPDGSIPNELLWDIVSTNSAGSISLLNNKVRIEKNDVILSSMQLTSVYRFKGDFDIQIDFKEELVNTNTSTVYPCEFILSGGSYWFVCNTKKTNSGIQNYTINSAADDYTVSSAYHSSGKFRYVKVGNSVTFLYWSGSQWEYEGNTAGHTFSDICDSTDILVTIRSQTDAHSIVDFDAFRINLGTIVWPLGTQPNTKKIAIVYPSVQEHTVYKYDEYTKLLIHSDTTDGDTTFIDSSISEHIITANGNTKHSTIQAKFGGTSVYFDGNVDYLSIPDNSNFNFGNTDFTIDCWCYIPVVADDSGVIVARNSGSDPYPGWYLTIRINGSVAFNTNNNVQYALTPANVIMDSTWTHIACVYYSGTLYIYVQGILEASEVCNSIQSYSTSLLIGRLNVGYSGLFISGYIDEFRISKGIARWTSNFTPPNQMYYKDYPITKQHIHGEQEQLFCEIENWDTSVSGSENAQLWVKVPKVLADQPTDLLFYYDKEQEDNDYYIGETSSWAAQQVWDENFMAVYHMAQDPSIGGACILDSTSNNNHGTPHAMDSNNLVDSPIGKCLNFVSPSQYISCGQLNFELDVNIGLTIEYSTNPSTDVSTCVTLGNADYNAINTGTSYGVVSSSTGSNWTTLLAEKVFTLNTWQRGHLVFKGTTITFGLDDLIDEYNSSDNATIINNTELKLAAHYSLNSSYMFDGKIKETRISNKNRTSVWLKTTNNSLRDNLNTLQKADIYQTSGYVTELGSPVERSVFLYDRISGELMDKVISNDLGYYSLRTTISGSHNIVCQDANSAPDFDDLIISKITPVETT